jgi:hypothetical protein
MNRIPTANIATVALAVLLSGVRRQPVRALVLCATKGNWRLRYCLAYLDDPLRCGFNLTLGFCHRVLKGLKSLGSARHGKDFRRET